MFEGGWVGGGGGGLIQISDSQTAREGGLGGGSERPFY